VIPILPIAIVVSDTILTIVNFRRLKQLEARMVRPVHSVRARA
jgi:hypothetical protein